MKSLYNRLARGALALCALTWLAPTVPAAMALPAEGATPVAELPYTLAYQGWFTVEGSLNGSGPHDFIVDSGATITSIFANLAERQEFASSPGRTIQLLGLSGAQSMPAYVLGDLEFSGVKLEDHVGVILPDWAPPNTPPQGVLGLDLLTRYAVHLDIEAKVFRLYAPETELERRRRWTRVKMARFPSSGPAAKLFMVTLKVGPTSMPCVIDLGASGTIFNTPALRQMLEDQLRNAVHQRGLRDGSRINDVFDISDRVQPVRIGRVKIGGAVWRNKVYVVYDAQIFKDLGYENEPFCLVGADIFAERSAVVDFAGERLYIGPRKK